jgi:hypothetical protein
MSKTQQETATELALRICAGKPTQAFSGGEVLLFATAEQFDELAKQLVAQKIGRLLNALDILDHGCAKPGFRQWQNGHGAPVGDEVQDALDELSTFVGHIKVEEELGEELS